MNNTKRIHLPIHAKKFYIPFYIPPLNFFRKYNSSITFSSSFIVLQTSQELNPAKNIWKPSSPTTFQHFSRKADNKNAILTDSKTVHECYYCFRRVKFDSREGRHFALTHINNVRGRSIIIIEGEVGFDLST